MALYGTFYIFASELQYIVKMPDKDCPNYINCQLIKKEHLVQDQSIRRKYIRDFCLGESGNWENCQRYLTKKALNFCPDFVLPDSKWSVNEILDIFEQQELGESDEDE